MRSRLRLAVLAAVLIALSVGATGCGAGIPSDPDGTLTAVRDSGFLRAGVTPNGELIDTGGAAPPGDEADAIRAFAASLDAEVDWTVGSEEALVRGLEDDRLDLVAGGITDQTPWVDRAAVTRTYREIRDAEGRTESLVMLVPLGENAFLSELETFPSDYVRSGS